MIEVLLYGPASGRRLPPAIVGSRYTQASPASGSQTTDRSSLGLSHFQAKIVLNLLSCSLLARQRDGSALGAADRLEGVWFPLLLDCKARCPPRQKSRVERPKAKVEPLST